MLFPLCGFRTLMWTTAGDASSPSRQARATVGLSTSMTGMNRTGLPW
jgi:hypothetical protein